MSRDLDCGSDSGLDLVFNKTSSENQRPKNLNFCSSDLIGYPATNSSCTSSLVSDNGSNDIGNPESVVRNPTGTPDTTNWISDVGSESSSITDESNRNLKNTGTMKKVVINETPESRKLSTPPSSLPRSLTRMNSPARNSVSTTPDRTQLNRLSRTLSLRRPNRMDYSIIGTGSPSMTRSTAETKITNSTNKVLSTPKSDGRWPFVTPKKANPSAKLTQHTDSPIVKNRAVTQNTFGTFPRRKKPVNDSTPVIRNRHRSSSREASIRLHSPMSEFFTVNSVPGILKHADPSERLILDNETKNLSNQISLLYELFYNKCSSLATKSPTNIEDDMCKAVHMNAQLITTILDSLSDPNNTTDTNYCEKILARLSHSYQAKKIIDEKSEEIKKLEKEMRLMVNQLERAKSQQSMLLKERLEADKCTVEMQEFLVMEKRIVGESLAEAVEKIEELNKKLFDRDSEIASIKNKYDFLLRTNEQKRQEYTAMTVKYNAIDNRYKEIALTMKSSSELDKLTTAIREFFTAINDNLENDIQNELQNRIKNLIEKIKLHNEFDQKHFNEYLPSIECETEPTLLDSESIDESEKNSRRASCSSLTHSLKEEVNSSSENGSLVKQNTDSINRKRIETEMQHELDNYLPSNTLVNVSQYITELRKTLIELLEYFMNNFVNGKSNTSEDNQEVLLKNFVELSIESNNETVIDKFSQSISKLDEESVKSIREDLQPIAPNLKNIYNMIDCVLLVLNNNANKKTGSTVIRAMQTTLEKTNYQLAQILPYLTSMPNKSDVNANGN